jgi:hypothetical protein
MKNRIGIYMEGNDMDVYTNLDVHSCECSRGALASAGACD